MIKRIVVAVALVIALVGLPACSSTANTNNVGAINLQQMSADITTLKNSFSVLDSAFKALSAQIGQGGVSQSTFNTLQSEYNALKTKVDGIVIPPPSTSGVKQSDLDALNTKITAANATITSLNTSVASLQTELLAAQTKNTVQDASLASIGNRVTIIENKPSTQVAGVQAHLTSLSSAYGGLSTIISGTIDQAGVFAVIVTAYGVSNNTTFTMNTAGATGMIKNPLYPMVINGATTAGSPINVVLCYLPLTSFKVGDLFSITLSGTAMFYFATVTTGIFGM